MTDKQIICACAGSAISFIVGLVLLSLIAFGYETFGGHLDGGDDGLAILTMAFFLVCAVMGFFFSARWARNRFPEFEA